MKQKLMSKQLTEINMEFFQKKILKNNVDNDHLKNVHII